MFSNPIVLIIASLVGAVYLGGAYLMSQMRHARPGYEDETGFHFLDEIETVVVPADDARPDWLTDSLVERFRCGRAEIFASAAA